MKRIKGLSIILFLIILINLQLFSLTNTQWFDMIKKIEITDYQAYKFINNYTGNLENIPLEFFNMAKGYLSNKKAKNSELLFKS